MTDLASGMLPGSRRLAGRKAPGSAGHLRLLTVRHLDGRSVASKRARAIAKELARGFPSPLTPMQRAAVERAAMLCAISEDLSARRLAGEPVALDAVIRMAGAARRAVETILRERPAKREDKPSPALGLDRILRNEGKGSP